MPTDILSRLAYIPHTHEQRGAIDPRQEPGLTTLLWNVIESEYNPNGTL